MSTLTVNGTTYHGVRSDVIKEDGRREIEFAWAEIPAGLTYRPGPLGGPEIERSGHRGAVAILNSEPSPPRP